MPTIALFSTVLAAVPLGIGRHAIDVLTELAATKIASRSRRPLGEDTTMQGALGRAEALLRSGRAFLHEMIGEAWQVVESGQRLSPKQRALLWLSATHAASAAKEATELMFSAGGSASPYTSSGLERCVRDIHAACQHVTMAQPNYEMAGQAFLGSDMRSTLLLMMDDRDGG
jgi:alkylation response protein AidB-like acyl-CoA dehydrogenase